jgi:Mn2+/Fe2+ NRAMP family transporter
MAVASDNHSAANASADASLDWQTELLKRVENKGFLTRAATYARLSGPGWLQGAITLGGGSLAGALYLGVIMGYELMWLQPLAMVLGVIMLSAISYVTLSTREKPFYSVRTHISPALAWAWLFASMLANVVWSLPQFALGTAAIQQNLIPASQGSVGKVIAAVGLLLAATFVVWFYNSGSRGIRIFEWILKAMVGTVVLSFFGVVAAMTRAGALPWGEIFAGMVPDPRALFQPSERLQPAIEATGPMAGWWADKITGLQKDKIITAFATAVGINMTFLLPYSMLRKQWGKTHRELAIFDLAIGLIVPFVLATGCVVIAASSQFHGKPDDVLAMVAAGEATKEVGEFEDLIGERNKQAAKLGVTPAEADSPAPEADQRLAAAIAGRDNLALAKTLEPLVGSRISQGLFGIGVLGMALSTIIILMIINGFCFCEMIGASPDGPMHRIGSLLPAVGVVGPFVWGAAAPALATPTSVIGGAMLPIAYFSFFLMMNSRVVLGPAMPRGGRRVFWNVLMVVATLVAGFASAWGLYEKSLYGFPLGKVALGLLVGLLLVGLISFARKEAAAKRAEPASAS